jgi:ABC-type multidrug transport system permease subunit
MAPYFALLASELRVSMRERSVVFFNYLFPLVFFFIFGELMNARASLGIAQFVVSTVLAIGIMGNGFFGMGMRAVQERELGILRRLRLAPITPAPVLFSSLVSGAIVYLPSAILTIVLGRWVYHMPSPPNLLSLLAFLIVGNLAFRSIGLIIASVADSMAEAQILVQILYVPMMFMSGTTFPITNLPRWIQTLATFLPATYLKAGLQGLLQNGETLSANTKSVAALLITLAVGFVVSFNVFRWSKEDRMSPRSKAWVAVVLAPFVVLGAWESYAGTQRAHQAVEYRQLLRNSSWHIHDARVFVGDGHVLDRADVYLKNGKITAIAEDTQSAPPDAASYTTVEAAGKTLIPGLIDVHAHLGASGIVMSEGFDQEMANWPERAVRSYLYSGVTAARSVGDATDDILKLERRLASGEILGAELFTASGGQGTQYFKSLPEMMKTPLEPQMDAVVSQGVGGLVSIELMAELSSKGTRFDPSLIELDSIFRIGKRDVSIVEDPIVRQTVPSKLLVKMRNWIQSHDVNPQEQVPDLNSTAAVKNLRAAYGARVPLVLGTDSGNYGIFHGAAVHREMELWQSAGIPPADILKAATTNAAQLVGAANRIGKIAAGYEANVVIIDGNPLEDIRGTRRISDVFFKGERIRRAALFEQ